MCHALDFARFWCGSHVDLQMCKMYCAECVNILNDYSMRMPEVPRPRACRLSSTRTHSPSIGPCSAAGATSAMSGPQGARPAPAPRAPPSASAAGWQPAPDPCAPRRPPVTACSAPSRAHLAPRCGARRAPRDRGRPHRAPRCRLTGPTTMQQPPCACFAPDTPALPKRCWGRYPKCVLKGGRPGPRRARLARRERVGHQRERALHQPGHQWAQPRARLRQVGLRVRLRRAAARLRRAHGLPCCCAGPRLSGGGSPQHTTPVSTLSRQALRSCERRPARGKRPRMSRIGAEERCCTVRARRSPAAGARLQQPDVPGVVDEQVEAEQLEAVGQREEAQLARHGLQRLACAGPGPPRRNPNS
jgi:hypothetical protein